MTGSGGYRTSSHTIATTDATATTPATTHPTAGRERDRSRRTGVDASRPGRVAPKRLPARAVTGIMTRMAPHRPRARGRAGRRAAAGRVRPGGAGAAERGGGRGEHRRGARRRAEVAPTAVAALQEYWRTQFPAAFGRPWRDISRFVPVHAARPQGAVRAVGRRRGGPGLLLPVGRRGGLGRRWAHPRGPARGRAHGRAGGAGPRGRARRADPAGPRRAAGPAAVALPHDPAGGDGRLLRGCRARPLRAAATAGPRARRRRSATGRCRRSSPSRIRSGSSPAIRRPTATRSTACRRSRTATTAPPPRARG